MPETASPSPVSGLAGDAALHQSLSAFMEQSPHGRSLLESLGLASLFAPGELDRLAPGLSLATVLDRLKADPGAFLGHLAACAAAAAELAAGEATPDAARVEANVPCALKAPLEIAFQEAAADQARKTGQRLAVTVQSENEASVSNQGDRLDSLDAVPDLTMAAGYNSLLDHPFQKRFVSPEHFAARPWPAVNARLAGHGFADPEGLYRVIGVNVFVLVADPARLDGRPVPETLEALLSDRFLQDVVVCGSGDKASGSLMLHVQSRFGPDAVRRLGRVVKAGMHPSQVIKHLGSGKPDCPAVAVMPYFFARLAGIRHPATVVWPRDGAPAMPFWQLVKRRARPGIADFAARLEGPEVGRICSGAFFPSLHPDVPCPLPAAAPLAWLGWDTIRDRDLGELRRQASAAFDTGRREARA